MHSDGLDYHNRWEYINAEVCITSPGFVFPYRSFYKQHTVYNLFLCNKLVWTLGKLKEHSSSVFYQLPVCLDEGTVYYMETPYIFHKHWMFAYTIVVLLSSFVAWCTYRPHTQQADQDIASKLSRQHLRDEVDIRDQSTLRKENNYLNHGSATNWGVLLTEQIVPGVTTVCIVPCTLGAMQSNIQVSTKIKILA